MEERVTIRFKDEEYSKIASLAKDSGFGISTFIREGILSHVHLLEGIEDDSSLKEIHENIKKMKEEMKVLIEEYNKILFFCLPPVGEDKKMSIKLLDSRLDFVRKNINRRLKENEQK